MDPLSITVSCISLLSVVGKTSLGIRTFIRGCRDAREDLFGIINDLSQLEFVLQLLRDDITVSDDQIIPKSLQDQVLSILTNCSDILERLDVTLQAYSGKAGTVKWASGYKREEIDSIRGSLKTYCTSLDLLLELVSISYSKAIKEDTSAVRVEVGDVKEDTTQILEELESLRSAIAQSAGTNDKFILQKYLNDLTTYAGTVCGDIDYQNDQKNEEEESQYTISGLDGASSHTIPDESPYIGPHSGPVGGFGQLPTRNNPNSTHPNACPCRDCRLSSTFPPSRAPTRASTPSTTSLSAEINGSQSDRETAGATREDCDWADCQRSSSTTTLQGGRATARRAPETSQTMEAETSSRPKRTQPPSESQGSLDKRLPTAPKTRQTIKVLVIGDHCGKRSLCQRFIDGTFERPEPDAKANDHEHYTWHGEANDAAVELDIWRINWSTKRELNLDKYPLVDVMILCYAIPRILSAANLRNILRDHHMNSPSTYNYGRVPFILVGTKMDLRYHRKTIETLTKRNALPPTFEHGQKLASDLDAKDYVECSAKTGEGVERVFQTAIAAYLGQMQADRERKEEVQRWLEEEEERKNSGLRGKLRNLFY